MRTSMRNARLENYPLVPHDLRALTMVLMNPQYSVITMTEDGSDNLYSSSVTDAEGGHHVMFISERMLRIASELRILNADGTFKTTPAGLNLEQVSSCMSLCAHNYGHPISISIIFSGMGKNGGARRIFFLFQ